LVTVEAFMHAPDRLRKAMASPPKHSAKAEH
jgi:hypothetical protein